MAVLTRVAPDVRDAILAGAHESGLGISDYVAKVLAEALDLPQFAPAAHPRSDQGVLPMVLEDSRLKQTA